MAATGMVGLRWRLIQSWYEAFIKHLYDDEQNS